MRIHESLASKIAEPLSQDFRLVQILDRPDESVQMALRLKGLDSDLSPRRSEDQAVQLEVPCPRIVSHPAPELHSLRDRDFAAIFLPTRNFADSSLPFIHHRSILLSLLPFHLVSPTPRVVL